MKDTGERPGQERGRRGLGTSREQELLSLWSWGASPSRRGRVRQPTSPRQPALLRLWGGLATWAPSIIDSIFSSLPAEGRMSCSVNARPQADGQVLCQGPCALCPPADGVRPQRPSLPPATLPLASRREDGARPVAFCHKPSSEAFSWGGLLSLSLSFVMGPRTCPHLIPAPRWGGGGPPGF